jgi:hypothetical protein
MDMTFPLLTTTTRNFSSWVEKSCVPSCSTSDIRCPANHARAVAATVRGNSARKRVQLAQVRRGHGGREDDGKAMARASSRRRVPLSPMLGGTRADAWHESHATQYVAAVVGANWRRKHSFSNAANRSSGGMSASQSMRS